MTRVTRYDVGRPGKVIRRDNGWITMPATIARPGVLAYRQKDGTVRRELVLSEELTKADSLATLEGVPVTVEHPPTGLLDAKTTTAYAVGHVGEKVSFDGEHIQASITVHDAKGVTEIDNGRREVSAGYTVNLDFTPGVHPQFGEYDAVQRDRQYNHVAITRAGRAGPSVRLHLDSDAIEVTDEQLERNDAIMQKRKINGVEVELSEQAAALFDAEVARRDSEAAALKARADSAEAALATEKKARQDAEDPANLRKAVDARLGLERKASAVLGDATKLDAMSDREVMESVVAKVTPSMAEKIKGESDAYVAAAFDFATASYKPAPSDKVADARRTDADEKSRTDAESVRKKMIEDNRNAWKIKN